MPLQDHMQLVSTDDHLIEHPTVWHDRLPAVDRDRGPRIIEVATGKGGPPSQVWQYQGAEYRQIGLNAVAGKDRSEYALDPSRYDMMIAGCFDPVARVRDMDLDGVGAALCFPSFPGFAGTVFLEGQDRGLALRCVQAYNDFVLDEWCATAPDRYIPLLILPLWDVAASVTEIGRTAARGARAYCFPENPYARGLPSLHSDAWDPLFAAVCDVGAPLCMHFGSSGETPTTSPDAPLAVSIALFGTNSMKCLTDLLFSRVFHTHPTLRIALSEGGIGWVPWMLERIDYVWERHRFYQDIDQSGPPSQLWHSHVYGCFIDDDFGVRSRHDVGIDNITWECDYPHSDSNFPHSRKRAAEMLVNVPDDEVHKIVELNARRLFNFPRPPGLSLLPSANIADER